jgi:hypothetical protein
MSLILAFCLGECVLVFEDLLTERHDFGYDGVGLLRTDGVRGADPFHFHADLIDSFPRVAVRRHGKLVRGDELGEQIAGGINFFSTSVNAAPTSFAAFFNLSSRKGCS